MSLLDIVLGQNIILITFGLAAVPLLAAFFIALQPALRRQRARRAKIKRLRQREAAIEAQAAAAQAEQAQQTQPAQPAEPAETVLLPQQPTDPSEATTRVAPGQGDTGAVDSPPGPEDESDDDAPQAQAIADDTQTVNVNDADDVYDDEDDDDEETDDEQAPDAIQDILSSVFEDDGENDRFDVLLRGQQDVPAEDVLALAEEVVEQLHARNAHATPEGAS